MSSGYDLSSVQYTPEGVVLQIDYANKAVDKSYTIIGLVGKDAVVLAVDKAITTPLYEPDADERIFNIDLTIGMAVAGFPPDGNYVVEMAREEAMSYRENLGSGTGITIGELAARVGGYVHAYTLYSAVRPFGLIILMAAWDDDDGAQLFKIDPSGAYYGYKAYACGKWKRQALNEIAGLNLKYMGRKQLVKTAGEIIYKIHDDPQDKDFRFEMGIVGQFTNGLLLINPPELTEMARRAGQAALEEDDSDESSD